MSEKYKNSAIIEALCEIRFKPSNKWDWTIPGLVYSEIKEDYPLKREIKGIGFNFSIKPNDPITSNVLEKIDRLQFLNESENRLVQVGENILSINELKPYDSWDSFKSEILKNLKTYWKIANPSGINRIGLRYINKFDNLPERIEIEEYFNYHPKYLMKIK